MPLLQTRFCFFRGVFAIYIYTVYISVNYTTSHIIQVIPHYTTIFVSIPGFDAELPLTSPLVPLKNRLGAGFHDLPRSGLHAAR